MIIEINSLSTSIDAVDSPYQSAMQEPLEFFTSFPHSFCKSEE
jgi:hypothetical protein